MSEEVKESLGNELGSSNKVTAVNPQNIVHVIELGQLLFCYEGLRTNMRSEEKERVSLVSVACKLVPEDLVVPFLF